LGWVAPDGPAAVTGGSRVRTLVRRIRVWLVGPGTSPWPGAGGRAALGRESVPATEWAAPEPRGGGFRDGATFSRFDMPARDVPLARERERVSTGRQSPTGESPTGADGHRAQVAAGKAASLRDVDLLATLLGLVLPVDPLPLAERVIGRFGSFAAVLAAPERELRGVPGLGTHCIAAIKLVHAAALRAARAAVMYRPVLADMERLTAYLTASLARERIEQFRVLFLDADDRLMADEAQARGTVNHTPVYPREVVKRALELRAASLILVHNHPSGDPTPSRDDLEMTAQVREAAELLDVALRDHVIVGNGKSLSFREAGLI